MTVAHEPRAEWQPPRPLRAVDAQRIEPVDSRFEEAAPPELGEAARQGPLGEWLAHVDRYTEAHPAALLIQALAGFGCLYGTRSWMTVGATRHHPRFNPLVVGPTSRGGKGDSLAEVMGLLERVNPMWVRTQVTEGLSSGEGLISRLADPDPAGPDADKVVDKRLMLTETEFARVLAQGRRDGNTVSAVIRQAWDGFGDLSVLTRHDPLRAARTHVVVVAHITPQEAKAKTSDVDAANGFLNRFLWVWSQRTKLIALPPERDATWESGAREVATQLAKACDVARGEVSFHPEAKGLWASIYEQLDAEQADGVAGLLVARAAPHICRVALCYALAERCPAIHTRHVEAAAAVWAYSRATIDYIWADDLILSRDAERLFKAIADRKDAGLSASHQSALFGRHKTADEMDQLRAELLAKGFIVAAREKTKGRAKVTAWATQWAPDWAVEASVS